MPQKNITSTIQLALTSLSVTLVLIITIAYGYNFQSRAEAVAGFTILLAVLGWFLNNRRRPAFCTNPAASQKAAGYGIAIGILWLVEICINNLLAPPLPDRDWVNNVFWATVALCILVLAAVSAYLANSIRRGISSGIWSGFASGLRSHILPHSIQSTLS
jgi:hypothetical protein